MALPTVIAIVVSISALLVSITAWRDTRRRDRRDLYLRFHEVLIGEDRQVGRQLLFKKVSDDASVTRLTDDEYQKINRALNTYELLGLYVRRGYVPEQDVMEMWAVPIFRAWVRGAAFVKNRAQYQGTDIWPHYRFLAQKSKAYIEEHGIEIDESALRPPDT